MRVEIEGKHVFVLVEATIGSAFKEAISGIAIPVASHDKITRIAVGDGGVVRRMSFFSFRADP